MRRRVRSVSGKPSNLIWPLEDPNSRRNMLQMISAAIPAGYIGLIRAFSPKKKVPRTHNKTGNYKPSLDQGRGGGLMLKKFMEKVGKALGIERDMFDPSVLGDPVAMQTDWTPEKKKGGASFRTHKLVESNSNRLEFRVSTEAKLFYLTFLGLGVVTLIVFLCIISFGWAKVSWLTLCPIVVGLAFTTAGARGLYIRTAPIVFDRRRGFFWKGRKHPDHVFDKRIPSGCATCDQS
jgi:hypothetical protein